MFDTVFKTEGVEIIRTPYRAPNANAFAERWVRTVREECLDHVLILNEMHLQRVLMQYISYYNHRRGHQGIGQQTPVPLTEKPKAKEHMEQMEHKEQAAISREKSVQRRDVLGGIIHDYYYDDCQAA